MISLEKSENLDGLQMDQKDMVAEYIQVKSYLEGDIVIPSQTKCSSGLWIVLKGRLEGSEELVFNLFDIAGDKQIEDSSSE